MAKENEYNRRTSINVQSDWNATTGDAFIKNKPSLVGSSISITDAGNYYTGTEVETALQEVGADLLLPVDVDDLDTPRAFPVVIDRVEDTDAEWDAGTHSGTDAVSDDLKLLQATNGVTNGNFASTASWSQSYLTGFAVSSNVASFTATAQFGSLYQNIATTVYQSKVIVLIAEIKSTSNAVYLSITDGVGSSRIAHSGSNNWETISIKHTLSATGTFLQFYCEDFRASGYDTIYIKNVRAIDLTALFGAGNEPTVSECDEMFATWFDSTAYLTKGWHVSPALSLNTIPKVTASAISWSTTGTVTVWCGVNTSDSVEPTYTQATSGSAIPGISVNDDLTGKYLWVKAILSGDTTATPALSSITVDIDGTTTVIPNGLPLIADDTSTGGMKWSQAVTLTDNSFTLNTSVWDDIQFNVESGRVAAANFPDWDATFTANTGCFKFAVDDYIDLGTNEMSHWWKEGTAIKPHVHIALDGANATGSSRYAKFTLYMAYADESGVFTETSATGEVEIPDATADLTHLFVTLTDVDFSALTIGTQVNVRLKRIAATTGTEYANHVFVTQVGIHAEKNALGSSSIASK